MIRKKLNGRQTVRKAFDWISLGRGHPIGATGIAQAHEIVLQLRGEAKERQVKNARIGFTCNFGGFGNNVVCLTFIKED